MPSAVLQAPPPGSEVVVQGSLAWLEPETLARLERVVAGLQEMRGLPNRVMELEERVDFAERLLPRPDGRVVREQARE